jgi:hypothetical protein
MSVEYVEFIVEEPSMEALLRCIAPRLLGDIPFDVFPFQSKDELLRELPKRLSGYAAWMPPAHCIVVIVDQDDDDCRQLKQQLEQAAARAGLYTRSRPDGNRFSVINRIVVEELEAWYLGDWNAVCTAYPRVSRNAIQQRALRSPDAVRGGTWEAFHRVLKNAGYFKNGLRKNEIARTIGPHMDVESNSSPSFRVLRTALAELTRS